MATQGTPVLLSYTQDNYNVGSVQPVQDSNKSLLNIHSLKLPIGETLIRAVNDIHNRQAVMTHVLWSTGHCEVFIFESPTILGHWGTSTVAGCVVLIVYRV